MTGARFGVLRLGTLLLYAVAITLAVLPIIPFGFEPRLRKRLLIVNCWLLGVALLGANVEPRVSNYRSATNEISDQGWPLLARQKLVPESGGPLASTRVDWYPYGVLCNLSVLVCIVGAIPVLIHLSTKLRWRFSIRTILLITTVLAVLAAFLSNASVTSMGITDYNVAPPFSNGHFVFAIVAASVVINGIAVGAILATCFRGLPVNSEKQHPV